MIYELKQCFEQKEFVFWANHSTETALVKIVNNIMSIMDLTKTSSVLILLNLSPAFYAVNHPILLDRLHNVVGLYDTVFNWFNHILNNILPTKNFMQPLMNVQQKNYKINCGLP